MENDWRPGTRMIFTLLVKGLKKRLEAEDPDLTEARLRAEMETFLNEMPATAASLGLNSKMTREGVELLIEIIEAEFGFKLSPPEDLPN